VGYIRRELYSFKNGPFEAAMIDSMIIRDTRALLIDEFATSLNMAHTPLGRQLPNVWAEILNEQLDLAVGFWNIIPRTRGVPNKNYDRRT